MDKWQEHVFDKVSAFIDEDFKYDEKEVTISLNQREAYVVRKALQAQEKHENPLLGPVTVPAFNEPLVQHPSDLSGDG